jgi:uncharacterized membrane protein YeaQ/YmgE (transglycosylase-associated protein family)
VISWILWNIVVGLFFGSMGRLIAPGKQDISIPVTIAVGVAASFLGGLIAWIIPFGGGFFDFVIRVVLAVIGVIWAANRFARKPA